MNKPLDDEALANLFSRAYGDTGNIADAFWVVTAIVKRQETVDVGAVRINEIIADVARRHEMAPKKVLGTSRERHVVAARDEAFWLLRQRRLSFEAIGVAFDKNHATVIYGVRKFEKRLAESVDLRVRMGWEVQRWQRAA